MSGQGYGMMGHVGICFQNSFGTSKVTSMEYFKIINESLVENIPPIVQEGMSGRFEEGNSFEGAHDVAGDIQVEIHPILIGKLLQAWTNASCNVTLGTSAYTHVMKPATSDWGALAAVQPVTIEVYRDAGSAFLFYDCCLNDFSIEIANGVLHKATASFVGGKFSKATKTTPTYLPGSEYSWDQTSITFTNSAGSLVAINDVVNMTINGTNSLEAKHTLNGTKTPSRIKRSGYRTMEVNGTFLFSNMDEFDKFNSQKPQQMVITTVGQNVSATEKAMLKIDMPLVRYNSFPPNIGGPGMIEVGASAAVKYHADSGTMVQFTLVNTRNYYTT